jgi:hypothetical protein
MNATHEALFELRSGLPWAKVVVTGIIAALSYFVVNLVARRRFYRDLVCSYLLCIAEHLMLLLSTLTIAILNRKSLALTWPA